MAPLYHLAMYSATTHDIKVSVRPSFLEAQSSPEEHHFVWAYHVRIENLSRREVQLVARTWHITDAQGRRQTVHGQGVVGEQPVLKPGQSFEYTSGTPLPTPSGFMTGRYEMRDTSGAVFEVDIPAFSLDLPHDKPRVN